MFPEDPVHLLGGVDKAVAALPLPGQLTEQGVIKLQAQPDGAEVNPLLGVSQGLGRNLGRVGDALVGNAICQQDDPVVAADVEMALHLL